LKPPDFIDPVHGNAQVPCEDGGRRTGKRQPPADLKTAFVVLQRARAITSQHKHIPDLEEGQTYVAGQSIETGSAAKRRSKMPRVQTHLIQ
jgi:hypothetical protein